jgi:hypothetical protein
MSHPAPTGTEILAGLRGRLAEEGLHVVLPLGAAAFDEASVARGGPRLTALWPRAAGAVLVGDGGPTFFARSGGGTADAPTPLSADPLDDFTRARVAASVAEALRPWGLPFRILHPFVGDRRGKDPVLPFQRLGQAAGLPEPGPLGLQIHPIFGPWWAYRACVLVPVALATEPPLAPSCATCSRPCVAACPAGAVVDGGFQFDRCVARRRVDAACQESCAARLRCPVGLAQRYPDDQLGFHMRASLAHLPAPPPTTETPPSTPPPPTTETPPSPPSTPPPPIVQST